MIDQGFRNQYPFASHTLALGNETMHYLDEGKGEAVVMVHGNPTWSFYYRRVVEALRPTHRTIVPDHIGCGFSSKPQDYPYTLKTHIDNLETLLAATLGEREPVTLIVHDWGGAIGMGWAVRHPERVRRIVVLNTAAFCSARIPWRINVCRVPGLGAFLIRGFNAFAGAAVHMAVAKHGRMTPEVKAGYLKPYDSWHNRIATLRFVQDIPLHAGIASYPVLQEIEAGLMRFSRTPMLIQWGGLDWCFDRWFYDEWRKRFPQAMAEYFADAGHYVLEDAHERIIPNLKRFLGLI